ATPAATILLGTIIFGLIHSATVRGSVVQVLLLMGRGLRGVALDLPALVLSLHPVRWLLSSRPVVWFGQYLARPTAAGLTIGLIGSLALNPREALVAGAATFLAGCFFFNSRLAAELEEAFLDWLSRLWLRLGIELIPALFYFVMGVFKTIVEAIDRLVYTVDEWLRFRAGESQWTLAWKLVLGTAWFLVSYVIRLYVNLFIEPTTNPIKHFPVVTVAHKIMAPFLPALFMAIEPYFEKF